MWPRTLSFLLALFAFPTFGAQFTQTAGSYPVRGMVVNSITGEPIRGALVQIYSNRQRSVLTGADGIFQFADVPAGSVNLNVQKPGFFSLQAVQSPRAQASFALSGPDQPNVVIKLVPEAVISGHITGDNGEAVESFPVQIFSERVENGKKMRVPFRGASSDEEGEFRIAELPPGKYFVFVGPSGMPDIAFLRGSQPVVRGYPATFYPGGNDISAANAIEVAAGQHLEINLGLASQPFYRISGTVSGYPRNSGVNLQVMNAAGQQMGAGFQFDQRAGTFRSAWLPAGMYTLTLETRDPEGGREYFASQNVNLSSDISGIHLLLLPNVNVPVSFRVERTRNEPLPETHTFVFSSGARGMQRRQVNTPLAHVELIPQNDAFSQQRRFSQVEGEDSSVELRGVLPGVYSVQIFPNGPYYVQSARSGTLNLLEQGLTVAAGSAVEPIEVVLRDDFGSLEGSVTLEASDQSAMVIAIPEDGQGQIRNTQLARPSGNMDALHSAAVFRMPQLAPGTYKLLAVDRPDDFEYGNPEVLQKYAGKAREILVSPNQQAKIELELVHIGE